VAAHQYIGRRSLAVTFGISGAFVQVLAAAAAWRSTELATPQALAYLASAALWAPWCAIGALIAARGIRTQGSTMLALAVTGLGFNSSLRAVPILFDSVPPWLLPLDLASALIAAGAYLRSSQLFPRPLTRNQVLSRKARLRRLRRLQPLLAAMLRPWIDWVIAAAWVAVRFLLPEPFDPLSTVALVLLGAAFWRVHIRVGNATVRERVIWIMHMVTVFAVMYLVRATLVPLLRIGGVDQEIRAYVAVVYNMILALAGCGSLAMAVFSAGAFNADFVLRRTLAYGAVIALLLFVLNVILSVAVESAANAVGLSDRLVVATLGTTAGILFEPLVRSVETILERLEPDDKGEVA
jgi:hypothetical protein